MKSKLPDPQIFIGQTIPGHDYVIEKLLGSGLNAHVFLARSPVIQREVACKIIPLDNLIGPSHSTSSQLSGNWMEEIRKANLVTSNKVVKFYRLDQWTEQSCVYALSDYIRGASLREHIKKNTVDINFVVDFLENMLDFLRELQASYLTHGDFHSGNILVEDRSESLLISRPYEFRVTDFGVAPITSGAQLLDDFEQLGLMLKELLARINYQDCSARDRFLFRVIQDDFISKRLIEHDVSYDPRARNPKALFEVLTNAKKEAAAQGATTARRTLNSPFEYLSCEQIGESHALLKELYSDKMLGLPSIEDRTNLVLTGPRGCGKTTVFRSISLKHRYFTEDDLADNVKYLGIYYRCSDDLHFSFARYAPPKRAAAVDVPMHFIVATLLKELLDSISLWATRHFKSAFHREEADTSILLWDYLGLSKPQSPTANSLSAISKSLDAERKYAVKKQRFVNDPKHPDSSFLDLFGPETLLAAAKILAENFTFIEGRPFFFLIDDYSTPKISRDLQRNLNRLFMQRSAYCFFKLATESPASYESSDIDGKAYVEGREFRLTNLGIDFISAEAPEKLTFVDDVFNRRFKYTPQYPISLLSELIGDDEPGQSHNEIARAIREKKHPTIWGRKALSDLCSGDVHYLIELVSKMVNEVGGAESLRRSKRPAIDPEIQNKAIRAESGAFMKNLRALPNGPQLVEVVEAFGKVAASYLRHKDSKNESGSPPHQASRIEPYEEPHLDGRAKEVYDELLRYSVFIEDVRGKSRRNNVVPRLYLRRFLIPFFSLTFSKRDSLELNVDEFNMLLTQPKFFEEKKRLKQSEGSQGEQLSLLSTPDRGNTGD